MIELDLLAGVLLQWIDQRLVEVHLLSALLGRDDGEHERARVLALLCLRGRCGQPQPGDYREGGKI